MEIFGRIIALNEREVKNVEITTKMAKQITSWSYREHSGNAGERKAAEYGIALILENITKLVVLCGIGFLLDRGLETILILLSFCSLRGQAGGFHSKSNLGCTLCMLGVWGISLGLAEMWNPPAYLLFLLYLGVNVLLYLFAPADFHDHCRLTEDKKKKKKLTAMAIANLGFLVALFLPTGSTKLLIIVPMCIEAATIIPFQQIFKKKGEENHERKKKYYGENCS